MKSRDFIAIQMHYENRPYKEISAATGRAEGTIKNWFMEKGRLHDAYMAFEEKENNERLRIARRLFKQNIHAAAGTMVNLLSSEYPANVRLGAAEKIVDRVEGKPVERVAQVEDPAEQIVNAVIEDAKRPAGDGQ